MGERSFLVLKKKPELWGALEMLDVPAVPLAVATSWELWFTHLSSCHTASGKKQDMKKCVWFWCFTERKASRDNLSIRAGWGGGENSDTPES